MLAHQANAVDVIAHRGYSCPANENSIGSVENAWLAGADGVEVDVRVSNDGIAYLFHDEKISKTKVEKLSFQQILEFSTEPVPTLLQLVSHAQSNGYYVFDLKTSNTNDLLEILNVIEASPLTEASLSFQSDDLEVLDQVRNRLPNAHLSYLTRLKRKFPYFVHPRPQQILAKVTNRNIDRISIKDRSFVDKKFIDVLKSDGHQVHVWTVNESSRAIFYRDLGVDGIITDNVESIFSTATNVLNRAAACQKSL